MTGDEKPWWVKGLVKSSGVALVFVLLHIADDLAAGGFGAQSLAFATGTIFIAAAGWPASR